MPFGGSGMPSDDPFGFYVSTIAANTIEAISVADPLNRVAVIVFQADKEPRLYSGAAAVDLIPMLHALQEKMEAGRLRMPVTDAVRWVEVEDPADAHMASLYREPEE
jgi:hypothetical protein